MDELMEFFNSNAMEIILHAGDARLAIMTALDALAEKKMECVEEKMKEALEEIQEAHHIQTSVIQSVASQETQEHYSILFTHAQDTLMTIYSEYNLANKMIQIFLAWEKGDHHAN